MGILQETINVLFGTPEQRQAIKEYEKQRNLHGLPFDLWKVGGIIGFLQWLQRDKEADKQSGGGAGSGWWE